MLLRRCELDGQLRDVRISGECIAAVAPKLAPLPGELERDAAGGALLPGLNDHHLHLYGAAAALRSVQCGPPAVRGAGALADALARAPGAGWLRGAGYHESVAGPLGRDQLDRWLAARPVRIQHRTGALWMLNGAAIAELGLDAGVDAPGIERDAAGRATGRLFRLDAWLGARLPRERVSLAELSRRLARCGVTGVTDAGADNDASRFGALAEAQRAGELLQRAIVMGDASLPAASTPELARGALKLLLDERALPELGAFCARIAAAHRAGRAAAVHAVTRVELTFALAAFTEVGARPGDRIEHASIAPPESVETIRRLGLTVVTQPSFISERGDAYARDVEPADRPWLYRTRGFLAAGVPLAAGSDAPYGEPDPWRAMRAAVARRSEGGHVLGSAEALTPEEALALFTSPLEAPGGAAPRLGSGTRADLCLLRAPWLRARCALSADLVAATWRAGELIFEADVARANPRAPSGAAGDSPRPATPGGE
jgi:predicted amidohydrolase YtcJ